MEFKKEDNEIQWQKEQEREKRAFDFDAFLGAENLDDKVTDVTDGKDLLEPDAFDHFAPDYIPRRPYDSEHGRHEAPEPENFQPEQPLSPTPEAAKTGMDPNDPRYAAPERPHVVVADPHAKKVYVSPVGDDYEPSRTSSGRGGGKGGIIGVLVVLAVIAVVLLVKIGGSSGSSDEAEATPKATSPTVATEAVQNTEAPVPTQTAETTKKNYTITVTAGSGGSISPSGAVNVEEGGSQTFAILPNSGYVISQVLVDGTAVEPSDSYTFSNVTGGHTIYAVFQAAATDTPAPTVTPEPTAAPTPEPTPEPTPDPTEPPQAEEPVTEPAGEEQSEQMTLPGDE
jgi:hypothetical protein